MEVDQDWEVYSDEEQQSTSATSASHLEVWLKLLPGWAWVVLATIAAVVLESILVVVVAPVGSTLRTTWSIT